MRTQHQPNAAMQETTPAPSPAPEDDLLGCPFCGYPACSSKDNMFFVGCSGCGVGFLTDELEDAKALWNSRA